MKSQAICAASLGVALILFAPQVSAQNRCKMSWESPPSDTKYHQQLALDVGDIPGHQIQIFELHRVYSDAKPNCEGLKWVEQWARGFRDVIDRNGHVWDYDVKTFENGDKIFARNDGSSQTVVSPDGAKKSTATGVTTLTGGTGKFRGIQVR